MENLGESEFLGNDGDEDLLAYNQLAFGRLRLDEDSHLPSPMYKHVQVRVTYKLESKPSKHVAFLIEFASVSRPFQTRYSALERFHRHMCRHYPELREEIPFPKKRLRKNFDQAVIMKRIELIALYFDHLLNGRDFKYRDSSTLKDFLIRDLRMKYRSALRSELFEQALNNLMPILDLLEILELICADRVTALTLICLCNAKSGQVDTAKMFSQKTLQLITSNSKIFSAKKYSSLISEAISVAGKVSSHTELNAYQVSSEMEDAGTPRSTISTTASFAEDIE